MPRARAGSIFDENSGARTNSGEIAREDEDEAGDLLLAELREQVLGPHPPTSFGIWP